MSTTTAAKEPSQLTSSDDIVRLAQACAPLPPHLLCHDSHTVLLSHLTALSFSSSSSSVSEYAQSLLSLISLSPQTDSLSTLFGSLTLSYVDLFTSDRIAHDSNSLKTLEFFAALLDRAPIDAIRRTLELVVEYFPRIADSDDAQIVDLIPRCINLARNSGGGDLAMSAVDRVLDCVWSKGLLAKMVSVARDFPFLDKTRAQEFIGKVFDEMSGVDLQDLPSLVYQLLVLASKGFGKREIIEGIVVFFGSKVDKRSNSIMKQVEGTVLLHVNFAVKQDPSLGKEIIGLMKSDLRSFNHFTVVILLSIARVRRFEESCIGTLKTALVTFYRDHKFVKDCKWLSDNLKEEYLQNIKVVEKAILRAVIESNYGREHIVPSIVQFAFALLELVEEANCKGNFHTIDLLGLEGLAFQMMKSLFEAHDMARNEIIEQCKFRILSLKPDQSMAILRLLGNLVQSYPQTILENVPRLKELLDYFTFMNGKVALGTVTALLPLTKFSRDLQDYTILVLRKAMFRQEEPIRLAATNAIIDLILVEKQQTKDEPFSCQDSSSQAGCSQQGDRACGGVQSLFQELSGLLQRCLYQQVKIKEAVYKGLVKLVLVDPSAGSAVFDLLLPHFLHYFGENVDIELGISSCVKSVNGKFHIDEPLDSLLGCVSWILLLQPNGKTDRASDSSWACFGFSLTQDNEGERCSSVESCSNAFLKIRKFLRSQKSLGILGQTHQSQDGSSPLLDSDKRKCLTLVLSGVIEVVLNIIVNELEKATTDINKLDLEKELIELVELHESLERESSSSKRANKIHESSEPESHSKGANSFLSTSSIYQIMKMIPKLCDFKPHDKIRASQNHSQGSKSKPCSSVISFVLGVCLRHIKSFSVLGEDDPLRTLIYGDIMLVGPPLLRLINNFQMKKEIKGKKEIEEHREFFHRALVCLKELITISLNKSSDSTSLLEDLLSVLSLKDSDLNEECQRASRINNQPTRKKELFVLKILKPLLFKLLELSFSDEVEVICSIVSMVGEKLPCELRNSHGSWSLRLCKEKKLSNPKVAKSIVTLAISLSSPPNDLTIAQDIARELQKVMGSELHESITVSEVYPILNHSTSNAISSWLLRSIEVCIADMDWAIKKLKTLFSLTHKSSRASGSVFEENLYSRAEAVSKVLASFALTSLKESQADSFIRLATRFYKHLAQMSKLRIAPKGLKQTLPSLKFQKLVEITCSQLTVPLYNFVSDMQKIQQENSSGKGIINKIKRENKCIPDLIFQIEDYEKFLIHLSKLTKVNLLRHAKRSTARDFKIIEENRNSAPNNSNNRDPATAEKNPLEGCEDREENEPTRVLSSESGGSVLAAEDSDSDDDDEGRDDIQNSKRMRIASVVRD